MAELEARVTSEVDSVAEEVVETRRDLHRHPELSLHEERTAGVAAARSEQLGYSVRGGLGGTGVIADLDGGGGDGPTLMLRADMDALPILERGDGRAVISEVEGVMHACGHDGHVAMTLGAAHVLASLRDSWRGRVRLCFQPAEEIALGAVPMIDDGAVAGVDHVLGIHLWAPLQVGRVGVKDGPIFGSADEFGLTVRGRGGHGGMPHTSIDPVVAAAHVVLALQSIVSRETSPFAPAVVTVGRVEGGRAFNVIADEVRLRGTVRAVDPEDRERLLRRVAEVAAAIASASGASAEFERGAGCPPVISDAASA
ncbi:MAG TPA: M20 family metallopeptidase, partial [Candidatus Dormibacteraeota bacterium]|nr:M20 family metallopeptidase [Candidatus Dormibacteraeota bacterium]